MGITPVILLQRLPQDAPHAPRAAYCAASLLRAALERPEGAQLYKQPTDWIAAAIQSAVGLLQHSGGGCGGAGAFFDGLVAQEGARILQRVIWLDAREMLPGGAGEGVACDRCDGRCLQVQAVTASAVDGWCVVLANTTWRLNNGCKSWGRGYHRSCP